MVLSEPPLKRAKVEEECSDSAFPIFLKGLGDRTLVIRVCPSWSLEQMCDAIEHQSDCIYRPNHRDSVMTNSSLRGVLTLQWRGRVLDCQETKYTLGSLGITRDCTLQAQLRRSNLPSDLTKLPTEDFERPFFLFELSAAIKRLVCLHNNDESVLYPCMEMVVRVAEKNGESVREFLSYQFKQMPSTAALEAFSQLSDLALRKYLTKSVSTDSNQAGVKLLIFGSLCNNVVTGLRDSSMTAKFKDSCTLLQKEGDATNFFRGHVTAAFLTLLDFVSEGLLSKKVAVDAICDHMGRISQDHDAAQLRMSLLDSSSIQGVDPFEFFINPIIKMMPYLSITMAADKPLRRAAKVAIQLLQSLRCAFESLGKLLRGLDALFMMGLEERHVLNKSPKPRALSLKSFLPEALSDGKRILVQICTCLFLIQSMQRDQSNMDEHDSITIDEVQKQANENTKLILEHPMICAELNRYEVVYSMLPSKLPDVIIDQIPMQVKLHHICKYYPSLPIAYPEEAFEIIVCRRSLLISSFSQIMIIWGDLEEEENLSALESGLSVTFSDEDGRGPGVIRDWLTEVSAALFCPNYGLFVAIPSDPRTLHPSSAAAAALAGDNPDDWFKFAGIIAGLALRSNVPIGIFLSKAFFKMLLNEDIGLEDIKELVPEVYRSCRAVLDCPDAESVESLGLTFVASFETMGAHDEVPLLPQGDDISVTKDNRDEFVRLMARHYCCCGSSKSGAKAFRRGLLLVASDINFELTFSELTRHMHIQDFNGALGGESTIISVSHWIANTDVKGFEGDLLKVSIENFWKVVSSLSDAQRQQLLRFWTGLSNVPIGGFSALPKRLELIRDENPQHLLPSAHTCFFQLVLPVHVSYISMRDSLIEALKHGATDGFGMI